MGQDADDDEQIRKNQIIDYFANIEYKLNNESFDNDHGEEQLFIDNIFKEIESFGDTLFIFEHPDISKVLEKALSICSCTQLRQFTTTLLVPHLYDLMTRKCASHVVQTVLSSIPRILIEEHTHYRHHDSDDERDVSMAELLSKIVETVLSFEDLAQLFMDEKCAFVLRDLLWISSGVVRFDRTKKNNRMKLHHVRKIPHLDKFSLDHIPASVQQFAVQMAQKLLSANTMCFYGNERYRILCGSLQVLLECLFITKEHECLQRLIEEILTPKPKKSEQDATAHNSDNNTADKSESKSESKSDESSKKQYIYEMMLDDSTSRLLQTIFEFGDAMKNACSVVKHFLNAKEIRELAFNENGNFVLQSLLRRLSDVDSIKFVGTALQHETKALFERNRVGVIVCLIDAFARADLKANAIIKQVVEILKSDNDSNSNLIEAFLYLNVASGHKRRKLELKSKVLPSSTRFAVLGCLLLQSVVKCNSNFLLPTFGAAYLALSADRILALCKDSSGSHCMQCFVEAKHIPMDMKWRFVQKILPKFHTLCVNKFGNYFTESVFNSFDLEHKQKFALKLLESSSVLKGSKLGFILYSKMKLDLLQENETKWKQIIMKKQSPKNGVGGAKKEKVRSHTQSQKKNNYKNKKSNKNQKSKTKANEYRNKSAPQRQQSKNHVNNSYKKIKTKMKKAKKLY